jgi:hypothetical protein
MGMMISIAPVVLALDLGMANTMVLDLIERLVIISSFSFIGAGYYFFSRYQQTMGLPGGIFSVFEDEDRLVSARHKFERKHICKDDK